MRVYSAVRPTRRIWSFRFGWGIFPVGCSVGSSMVVQNGPFIRHPETQRADAADYVSQTVSAIYVSSARVLHHRGEPVAQPTVFALLTSPLRSHHCCVALAR